MPKGPGGTGSGRRRRIPGGGVAAVLHGDIGTGGALAAAAVAELKTAGIPAVQVPANPAAVWGTPGNMPSVPSRVRVRLDRPAEAIEILGGERTDA